ncbi:MAG: AAA family ATPase [Rikenellaceae bacterium]
MMKEQLRTNHKIELAREFILNTRANIFLTGRAGTGKTTMLREVIKSLGKRTVIAAPTGVAALNAGGVTLHSLFQLQFGVYIPGQKSVSRRISKRKISLIRSIEMLIIDEVSMVRSDLLDAIDATLRQIRRSTKPFAGVQLLLIGDIQQLSPICRDEEWDQLREHYATQYFFDSHALAKSNYVTIEFDEIFRQSDPRFTNILNAIRENRATIDVLEELNRRYIPNFEPTEEDDYITLTTHNNTANSINRRKLEALRSASHNFEAKISGDFSESAYPNETKLELKVGAQVLFIKNDISPEKRYYNGLIGRITNIANRKVTVQPKSGGDAITVEPVSWESIEYSVNGDNGDMEQSVKGSFSQIPLKCAWAITIHKSQGLSFDRAVIDASGSFAHGQVYVALSRCRTLEGMVLRTPITPSSIIGEINVDSFSTFVTQNQPSPETLEAFKRDYFTTVVSEIYNFDAMHRLMWEIMREMSGALTNSYPKLSEALTNYLATFDATVAKVGESFTKQIGGAIHSSEDYSTDNYIVERLRRASEYFTPRIETLRPICKLLYTVEPDSAETKRRIREFTSRLDAQLTLLLKSMELCAKGFSMEQYQQAKAKMLALQSLSEEEQRAAKGAKKSKESTPKRTSVSNDIIHPELYDTLVAWRKEESDEMNKPAYVVLPNRTLIQIQATLPATAKELSEIVGMGKVKMERYSDQLIDIVNDYRFSSGIGEK